MRLAFGDSVPVLYSHGLYHAGMGEVREELVRIPDNVGTVMVVGHNPGWESVVCWLSAENVQMTTANAALLKGAGPSWELAIASPGGWSLDALIRPKEL
jgi:phosphohistidine phosphatase SixA